MGKFFRFLLILLVVALIGGVVYLAGFDIPAPSVKVEKVIPDDQLK